MNGGEQIYCCNENVMMHVLENCSDIIGFKYYKIFKHYSLNVIKKIIEKDPHNFIDMFNNYHNVYYADSEECHAKLIYVFEHYLTNDKNCKSGNFYSKCTGTCWKVYLKAHRIRKWGAVWDASRKCYAKQGDIDLIVKLQNLLKKINMEEKVFNREINVIGFKDEYDIELLKKTPYLKVIEPEPSCCLIM